MSLPAARVQLLDPSSGKPITDVDVLSSAQWISYANSTQTIRDFRGIPKGSTFNDSNIGDVLDKILYPYVAPEVDYLSGNTTGLNTKIKSDKIIYQEKYITVSAFTLSVSVNVGSSDTLSIVFKKFEEDNSKVTQNQINVNVTPGSSYLANFEISEFVEDCSYQIILMDGESIIESPIITFKFIEPVFVGFCTDEFLMDSGIIDSDKATDYFNTLIRNNSNMIKKYVGPICNHKAMILTEPMYSNTEMFPFILYSNTLNKVVAIRDTNDIDLTASFIYSDILDIKTVADSSNDDQYTVYMSTFAYNVSFAATGEIKYNFIEDNSTVDFGGKGSPILAGFDILASAPIDYRTVVNTYTDLLSISKRYEGLVVYVKNENTFFKYTHEEWLPTNQQIFFEPDGDKDDDSYDLNLGSWNDIIINLGNGKIFQKLENRRWEYKGVLASGGTGGGSGTPGPAGKSATITVKSTTTGLPGTDAMVKNVGDSTDAKLEFTIPQGMPGENATIEIGEVTSGSTPSVTNVGTDTHAILDIVVPEGPKGQAGTAATVEVGEVKEGDSFNVVNTGSKTNAVFDFTFPSSANSNNVQLDDANIVLNMKVLSVMEDNNNEQSND